MKIGIDAKWFFNGPPSGKVVVKSITHHLIKNFSNLHTFYIFLSKSDENLEFPYLCENVKLVYVNSVINLISNALIIPYYANRLKIDVIIYQNFGSLFKASKSIVFIHDLLFLDYPEYYSFKERLYFKPMKLLSRKANSIVTISKSEMQRVLKYKFGSNKNVFYVYHGVDENFRSIEKLDNNRILDCRKKYNLPDNYILYVGRLNIRKNILNLIKALVNVKLPLVIVGEEDHKTENLKELIETLDLGDRVIFTGFVSDEDIPLVYAAAKVFCFPSFAEGFGMPPLEAMACGTPVIVSNITSLPEVCGDAAIYIDPDRPEDIAEKINSLLAKPPEDISKISMYGLSHARKFTWEKSAEGLMKIIIEKL